MAYKQTRSFDKGKAGSKVGFCLQNMRLGYGIPVKYPTATEAWKHTVQHKDRKIPNGVSVPLFYTYKTDGHVNVRMPSGEVVSDGKTYASLPDYERQHPTVHYLGWGETLNGVRVIEYVPDPKPVQSNTLPSVGSKIKLDRGVTRTTFDKNGNKVGSIYAKDDSYVYIVRGIHGNRVVINSASGGGNGVELALYYLAGGRIDGWKQL